MENFIHTVEDIPVILGNAARHFDLEPIECISTT